MKKEQKNAFDIKLEKETRKQLIKYIARIEGCLLIAFLIFFGFVSAESGYSIVTILAAQGPIFIVLIVLYIALIPFMWFMSKSNFRKIEYEKMLKAQSKSKVESMMTPGEPIRVILTKSKGDFGDFVLRLQEREKIELYAVLGEKDNLIAIYAVLKGEDEKFDLDVVTKEEFGDFYKFVDNS